MCKNALFFEEKRTFHLIVRRILAVTARLIMINLSFRHGLLQLQYISLVFSNYIIISSFLLKIFFYFSRHV
jgi:hypothetical protein